jgi:hypothetical protein
MAMVRVGEIERRVFITQEMVDAASRRLEDAAMGNGGILQALRLEREGGPCPLCRVPFRAVLVDNPCGRFAYYEPACRCYKKCMRIAHPRYFDPKVRRYVEGWSEGCGRWMVAEKLAGLDRCMDCPTYEPQAGGKDAKGPSRRKKEESRPKVIGQNGE